MSLKQTLFFAAIVVVSCYPSPANAGGAQTYDPNFSLCCMGTVLDKTFINTACCGTVTAPIAIDTLKQKCCDGVAATLSLKTKQACCGTKLVTLPATQICCSGRTFSKPQNTLIPIDCCGTATAPFTIETRKQMCCNGVAVNLIAGTKQDCCGSQLFNIETQICCYGKIFSKPTPTTDCCGSATAPITIDTLKQKCCDGVAVTLTPNTNQDCCGTKLVTLAVNQICCNGITLSKPTNTTDCCGSVAYETLKRECCLPV